MRHKISATIPDIDVAVIAEWEGTPAEYFEMLDGCIDRLPDIMALAEHIAKGWAIREPVRAASAPPYTSEELLKIILGR